MGCQILFLCLFFEKMVVKSIYCRTRGNCPYMLAILFYYFYVIFKLVPKPYLNRTKRNRESLRTPIINIHIKKRIPIKNIIKIYTKKSKYHNWSRSLLPSHIHTQVCLFTYPKKKKKSLPL